MFAPAIGYIAGALLQSAFTIIKYPGVKLIFGIHLNLYTGPVILSLFFNIGATVLLVTMFDGKMRIPPAEIKNPDEEQAEITQIPEKVQYDKLAVGLMLLNTIVFNFASLNMST